MFHHYLNSKDKEEMLSLRKQIQDQLLIVAALKQNFSLWFSGKIEKYKLDPAKKWILNPQTGQITEMPEKEKPKQ